MTAQAGEKAQKCGDFRCEKCHRKVHVKAGAPLPKCPHCGHARYDSRVNEPGSKSG